MGNNKTANLNWVHIFCDFVQSGAIAEMGTSAFAVLMAVKAHAAINDGKSCPSAETIAKYVGLSRRQVTRELDKLVQRGHLQRERTSRANKYTLTEQLVIKSEQGEPAEIASFPYIPQAIEQVRAQLKEYLTGMQLPEGSPIVIQQLNINVPIGANSPHFHNSIVSQVISDPKLQAKMEALEAKAKTKKNDNCG